MNNWAVISVFGGAGVGALLRWRLGLWLNHVFPTIPMGTVASNLVGGLLVGVFSAYFQRNASLPPELRLLIITGFLGGLTTFSTFSAEVVTLISEGELAWALAAASLHLFGSLLLTAAGMYVVNMLALRMTST
jgi:CrcB protein